MGGERYLIVNADDFGLSPGVNRGVIQAHEHGIVTSASLMVRWLAAREAALYARKHPELSLGLHLDLGEWVYRAGSWAPVYTVASLGDRPAVEREVYRQVDIFRHLVDREPSHMNSHQHVHMREPVRSVVRRLCDSLGIPLRNFCPGIHYFMEFYGQTNEGEPLPAYISLDWLVDSLSALPKGWTVMVCHPGDASDLETVYRTERREEVKVLCHRQLHAAIERLGIKLCSFNDWKSLKNSCSPSVR